MASQPLQRSTISNFGSTYFEVIKVVVCTDDLIVAIVSHLFSPKSVACCRPGMSSWSMTLCSYGRQYKDMAFHLGNLYSVANRGELFVHEVREDSDTREPKVSPVKQVIPAPPQISDAYMISEREIKCNLVISLTGKLLLVRWFLPYCNGFFGTRKDLKMEVFEADFVRSVWVEVQRLDDQVLFISSNCSKAMSASTDCDHLQGNRIYVLDEDIEFQYIWRKHHSCGCVYDMCSKTFHPISTGEQASDQWNVAWFFP